MRSELTITDDNVSYGEALAAFTDRAAKPAVITLNEHTYLPDGELTEGWFPNIARAFLALVSSRRQPVESYGSIGIGPGLDAILAAEILGARKMVLADIHEDVATLARQNVVRNCASVKEEDVFALGSDVCEALLAQGLQVEILYENLPNLPTVELDISDGVMSASFFQQRAELGPSSVYSRFRLSMHRRFLEQARSCITQAGAVICSIGGRVPFDLVRSMFTECGFKPQVLNFEMVRQFEADGVLPGYAQVEESEGIQFRYYPFAEARHALRDMRAEGLVSIDDAVADPRLQRICLSATEARTWHDTGRPIAHMGVVWLGSPLARQAGA